MKPDTAHIALKISDVSKSFGGLKILNGVSFDLGKGQVKGLIGPNGAGKTTLFNVITGHYPPDSGKVCMQVDGVTYKLTGMKPYLIARRGIGRTFQKPSLVWHMSAFENVLLAAMNRRRKGVLKGRHQLSQWVEHCLETAKIEPDLWHLEMSKTTIRTIKQTELARAICLAPKTILLDEICSGLSLVETDELTGIILDLSGKSHTSVLFVEHDLKAVQQVCSDLVVIDFGRIIFDGAVGEAFSNERVIKAYVGGDDA